MRIKIIDFESCQRAGKSDTQWSDILMSKETTSPECLILQAHTEYQMVHNALPMKTIIAQMVASCPTTANPCSDVWSLGVVMYSILTKKKLSLGRRADYTLNLIEIFYMFFLNFEKQQQQQQQQEEEEKVHRSKDEALVKSLTHLECALKDEKKIFYNGSSVDSNSTLLCENLKQLTKTLATKLDEDIVTPCLQINWKIRCTAKDVVAAIENFIAENNNNNNNNNIYNNDQ